VIDYIFTAEVSSNNTAEVSSNKFLGLAIISPLFSAYFILEQTISD